METPVLALLSVEGLESVLGFRSVLEPALRPQFAAALDLEPRFAAALDLEPRSVAVLDWEYSKPRSVELPFEADPFVAFRRVELLFEGVPPVVVLLTASSREAWILHPVRPQKRGQQGMLLSGKP